MRFFVKRPAAVDQFRTRANLPQEMDLELVENCLRAALTQAEETTFGIQRVFVLHLRDTVLYALGRSAAAGKPYDVILRHVLTQTEYDELRQQETPGRPKKRMRSKAMAA